MKIIFNPQVSDYFPYFWNLLNFSHLVKDYLVVGKKD